MNKNIALILVDGMRPDGLLQAEAPMLKRLMAKSTYTLQARTVLPSFTLPCIVSLIYSVRPQTHGTLTNTFASNAWAVPGLFDLLHSSGYQTASFFNWEQLRDLARPGSLDLVVCTNTSESTSLAAGESDRRLTELALFALRQQSADFVFLYLGGVDTAGHQYGWMSPEYISTIEKADDCIKRFLSEMPDDTLVFITADHGGIGYSHGDDSDDEMLIPLIIVADEIARGEINVPVSILDIAPTIAACAGIHAPLQWEGKALF